MDINNSYTNRNTYFQAQQFGLLGKTFMLTSVLFAISCGLMYVLMRFIPQSFIYTSGSFGLFIFLPIFVFIVSFVIYGAMMRNMNRPIQHNIIYLTMYTIMETAFYGFLLYWLNLVDQIQGGGAYLVNTIPFIFLLTALIAFVVGFLGYSMRNKTAMTLSRMLWIGIISWIVLSLVFSFAIYFLTNTGYKWLTFIYCFAGGALSMITIALQVNQIKRSQQFMEIQGETPKHVINNMAIFYSALLLSSLLSLVWYLARIFIALRE